MLNLSQVTAQIWELVNKKTHAGNLELFKPTTGDNTKLRFLKCISVCPVGGETPCFTVDYLDICVARSECMDHMDCCVQSLTSS